MSDLPKGWSRTSLEAIVEPKGARVSPSACPDSPYLGLEHVRAHTNEIIATVPAASMASSSVRFNSGDVLYGRMRPYLNKVVRPAFEGLASAEFIVFPETISIDSDFLLKRLSSADFVEFSCSQYEGDRPRVKFDALGKFTINLPPRSEQTRIVAKLEELLSDLDAGVAELKAAQKKLAQYRQSLLKAAVDGSLTAEWRSNNPATETGAELLERILKERRARWEAKQLAKFNEQGKTPPKDWQKKYPEPVQPDTTNLPKLPTGWVWATLDQLGQITTGFTPSTANHDNFGDAIPFIKPTDLEAGYAVISSRDYLSEMGAAAGRVLPAKSVLVTCIGATIGKTGLARVPCATNQQINSVSVDEFNVLPEFIYWLIVSGFGQDQIINNASATTLPILNKSKFEKIPVPLAPRQEQQQMVSQLEVEATRIQEQLSAIDASLRQSAAQRQNILRAAFAGQLVPQDPNDEPASVLLERIRAERTAQTDTKKGRTAKPRKVSL